MMKLPTSLVKIPQSDDSMIEVEVHAMSVHKLRAIASSNKEELRSVVGIVKELLNDGGSGLDGVAEELMLTVPDLMVSIISVSTNDKISIDIAKDLPIGLQAEILINCFDLSITQYGGLGKLAKMLAKVVEKLTN